MITFGFATFAYLWLFLVIFVISPAEVESWEAILTMVFYPVMLATVWWAETPNAEEEEQYSKSMTKTICKAML